MGGISRPIPRGRLGGLAGWGRLGSPGPYPGGGEVGGFDQRGLRPIPRGRLGGLAVGVSRSPGPGPWGSPYTEADTPQQTATAADGTHPPGMHSCSFSFFVMADRIYCYLYLQIFHGVSLEGTYDEPNLQFTTLLSLTAGQQVWLSPANLQGMRGFDGSDYESWFAGHLVHAL